MNSAKSSSYAQKVELLLRLIPLVMEENVFAIHGGTAINLFLKNLPRFSVDIDLTYIPLANRETSLNDINLHLGEICKNAKRAFKDMHIIHNAHTCKLLCEYRGKQVKVEVNQTKRGIVGGDVITIPLSDKAQNLFSLFCEAKIVPLTLLYGGKIAAAVSRQHPRDMFDIRYMDYPIEKCREGLIFCLLSSDRPLFESFAPSLLDQRRAMENQFMGMTDMDFTYSDFEKTRAKLIKDIRNIMTAEDKKFMISFETGQPEWDNYEFEYFKRYPSVQWKLLNIKKIAKRNPNKLGIQVNKLSAILYA